MLEALYSNKNLKQLTWFAVHYNIKLEVIEQIHLSETIRTVADLIPEKPFARIDYWKALNLINK